MSMNKSIVLSLIAILCLSLCCGWRIRLFLQAFRMERTVYNDFERRVTYPPLILYLIENCTI